MPPFVRFGGVFLLLAIVGRHALPLLRRSVRGRAASGAAGRLVPGYRSFAWLVAIGLLVSDLVLPIPNTMVMAALGVIYGPADRRSCGDARHVPLRPRRLRPLPPLRPPAGAEADRRGGSRRGRAAVRPLRRLGRGRLALAADRARGRLLHGGAGAHEILRVRARARLRRRAARLHSRRARLCRRRPAVADARRLRAPAAAALVRAASGRGGGRARKRRDDAGRGRHPRRRCGGDHRRPRRRRAAATASASSTRIAKARATSPFPSSCSTATACCCSSAPTKNTIPAGSGRTPAARIRAGTRARRNARRAGCAKSSASPSRSRNSPSWNMPLPSARSSRTRWSTVFAAAPMRASTSPASIRPRPRRSPGARSTRSPPTSGASGALLRLVPHLHGPPPRQGRGIRDPVLIHGHAMHSPPSMTSAWPVMNDERSEARKRIASAISSTLAKRPIGIFSFT